MKDMIEGIVYDTHTATLIARNLRGDVPRWAAWLKQDSGSDYERTGRNAYLYRTSEGRFFVHLVTTWRNEKDELEALTKERAKQVYCEMPEKVEKFL